MNVRSFFILFFCGAVFLAAFVLLRQNAPTVSSSTITAFAKQDAGRVSRAKSVKVTYRTNLVYVTNQFNWRDIESSDYRQYIANLRGISCPEGTIKDIILTDIMKLYAARRGQFFHNGREFKFWETDEKRKLNARQLAEREKQLASIDKELPAVLRELLGINYEREINKYFVDPNEEDRRLSFLPAEKRTELLALREHFEGLKEQILTAANGELSATDIEALGKLEKQRNSAVATLLSGAEAAEFELRMSPVADRLRAELVGFNPSEAEFRQIFEMQKAVEEQFAFATGADAAREKAEMENEVQAQLKREWGDARFAEFSRAQNPDFRDAQIFAEVYELPVSTAESIFDIKRIALAECQKLEDPSIPYEQRMQAMKAIQAETEKNLRATLGAKVFGNYSESSGKWLRQLGAN